LLDRRAGWRSETAHDVVDGEHLTLAPGCDAGAWTCCALDSGINRCAWGRVEVELARLPAGAAVELATASSDDDEPEWDLAVVPLPVPQPDWTTSGREDGAVDHERRDVTVDWPVRARPGRYLRVRLRLSATGVPPEVRAVRVHYPKTSTMDFLPAVFRSDETGRDMLDRFLDALDVTWAELVGRARALPSLLDPGAVPAGEPLRSLASWFRIPVTAPGRPAEVERRLLAAGIGSVRRRGTPEALRSALAALLGARGTGFPVVLEGSGAGSKPWLVLDDPARARLGSPVRLWSQHAVGRLRVGAYSTVGVARLVDVGDPARDLGALTTTGHRFQVYLPAAWLWERATVDAVHAVIAAERPATSSYTLHALPLRMVVDRQATVGVDTIVGAPGTIVGGQAVVGADTVVGPDAVSGREVVTR
jgi:phage tail-like protein